MPLRAYNLIFNEWFRDENLVPAVNVDTGDGPDLNANYVLLSRGKRHDYFTSSLCLIVCFGIIGSVSWVNSVILAIAPAFWFPRF